MMCCASLEVVIIPSHAGALQPKEQRQSPHLSDPAQRGDRELRL